MDFYPDLAPSPLSDSRRASGSLRREQSDALLDAAANLLTKAADRLYEGRDEFARRLATRAANLPHDDFEEVHPALHWLRLEMHTRLGDQLDQDPQNEPSWLSRIERLYSESTGEAAVAIRSGLVGIIDEYGFARPVERRIRKMIDEGPHEIDDEAEGGSADQRADTCLQVLGALNRLDELYTEDLKAENQALRAKLDALLPED